MSKEQANSKFEQIRSRRHMLNNLKAKPESKRDANLIGGRKAAKAKPIPKPEIKKSVEPKKGNSALQNNAQKVVGLEINQFKQWTGLDRENKPDFPINKGAAHKHKVPTNPLSGGIAFNNDRNAVGMGSTNMSGIMKKSDRDPMNVRDIDGASSKTKSYIMNKIYNKKSDIDRFIKSSSTIGNGMRYEPSETGNDRTFDTKRFMRVDDIPGAKPRDTFSITHAEKEYILSNDPMVQHVYENSHYYRKQRERQGKLPFTRRINKGKNMIDKSFMSTIDPMTGELPTNPYLQLSSMDRPNERMKRNLERLEEQIENELTSNALSDFRTRRIQSKRSHKLGLNKDQEAQIRYV